MDKFWNLFDRVLGVRAERNNVSVDEVEEWDSLRHVELVFELEETFGLSISRDDIVELYSDTDTILSYLHNHDGG